MEPQMPPYPPQNAAAPPYGAYYPPYPMMPLPPEKQYPVPAAKNVPTIWLISLVAVTVGAVALALGGGLLRPLAPAPYGTTLYASSLAQNDGAWALTSGSGQQCSFANGGMDATTDSSVTTFGPNCVLQNRTVNDFRLSVRLLPESAGNNPFYASVFVRNSDSAGVAFFISSAGDIEVDSSSQPDPVLSLVADQWHSDNQTGNTFVVQAQGSEYTLAMNGAEIYQGDFGGTTESAPGSGMIGLGAPPPISGTYEAIFADVSLTTP